MNVHLLIPELFWPQGAGVEPYRDLALPALETLLARGEGTRAAGASLERWLAAAYQLGGELPLAPYSLQGDGTEPGEHVWLRADPAHLRVLGDRLVLADASRLALTADEAREYIAALNPHFAADGMVFVAPDPRRWYVRIPAAPRLTTTPTSEVAGRSIESFLPAGDDGARWRSHFNEAQMLLHGHSCNQSREARGQLTVNSVWFWGGGRGGRLASCYGTLWTDHPIAHGLAAAAGERTLPLPASGAAILDGGHGGKGLVVLASLPATAYGDLAEWREALARLERSWFAPLLESARDRALASITLHGLGPDFSYTSALKPRDRWRFWRPRRRLHAYAVST